MGRRSGGRCLLKALVVFAGVGAFCLVRVGETPAQTNAAAPGISNSTPGLKKTFSEEPFLGTKRVLTLSGDYVNSPKEDFEAIGVWTPPLSLEEMHGMVAEIGFGDATKKGEWQLRFKRKIKTMDSAWQAMTDAARNVSLSDRRRQVFKASYNLKDWWQVGVSGLVEDKVGSDTGLDLIPLGIHNGQSLGFQIDTLFKF